jgi:hypothetical protein
VGLPLLISAAVFIAVDELLLPLAVLEKVSKISAIFGAATVDKVPLAVLLVVAPLALVIVTLWRTPNAKTVFLTFPPLPLKLLSVVPHEPSLAASLAILEIPRVHPVFIPLVAAHLDILFINPLVYLFFGDEDTLPVLFLPQHLPKVYVGFVWHDDEVGLLDQGN